MPNGWYPVPGLDVVLLNRTEQHSPRYEWRHSWSRLWAARLTGSRGHDPRGTLPPIRTDQLDFAGLVEAVRTVLTEQWEMASVLLVDFEARRGSACGRFVVYGFGDDGVKILHDHSLEAAAIAQGVSGDQLETVRQYRNVTTTGVGPDGLLEKGAPPSYEFEFSRFEQLVISTTALHHDPHWPPASILDVPAVALAQPDHIDALLALWRAPSE